MGVHRRKLPVQELEIGMFVADLDRPWHETPFPIQGFYIRNQQELDQLSRYCRQVFVDVAEARKKVQSASSDSQDKSGRRSDERVIKLPAVQIRTPHQYETTTPLKREIREVQPLLENVEDALDHVSDSIANGGAPDLEALESVSRSMVDSVARNPDALLWLSRIQSRDDYTYRHSLNIAIWALLLGRNLGLDPDVLHRLSLGALLSQVGKTQLRKELLVDENSLSGAALKEYRSYVAHGVKLLQQAKLPRVVLNIVRYHRERHNGSGFPAGVNGQEIPLLAKLVGLVDYYESLIEPRNTADQLTPAQATSHLFEKRNVLFQEDLVERFIQAVGIYPTGTIVELSTKEVAVVIAHKPKRRLWPEVMVLTDAEQRPLKNGRIVDLAKYNESADGDDALRITDCKPFGYAGIDPSEYEVTGASSRWSWRHLMG